MFDSIFTQAVEGSTSITLSGLLIALGTAFALGLMTSLVYIKTHKTKTPSQSFAVTLIILPAVITLIILLVGNSVARAFSLAGAFSIIRFRSAPTDAKDITFVLISMAIGLAAGMGYILCAAVASVILCAASALLAVVKFGSSGSEQRLLKITVPEDVDFKNAFEDVFEKYTKRANLKRIKTADLGSLYELQYSIAMNDDAGEKEFIDELRCRNGNLNIILALEAPTNEF